uniref:Death domain-containing protein n=1 Tax=Setaria digitata TaxID=48799 RepID=A0A915PS65_9BILA
MLTSRFLLFTIVISTVWAIPNKENSPAVRLKRQEYTFSSKSRLLPRSGANGIISFCCLPEPKKGPKHQIQSATASYEVIGSISSEDFNRGFRIQVPIHTVKFGRNFVASQGTVREIPVPKEFRQHEIFLRRPPYTKYGRPATVGGDDIVATLAAGPNSGTDRGKTIEDEPGRIKVDYLNLDPQIEVMASECTGKVATLLTDQSKINKYWIFDLISSSHLCRKYLIRDFSFMDKAVFALEFEQIKAAYKRMKDDGCAAEVIRLTIENAIHRKAFEIAQCTDNEQENLLRQLLTVTFQAAKEDFCAKGTTVAVMQDVFDVSPVKRCEELFVIVEDSLPRWKMSTFYEPCKNMILRMCNDLLKRLSRTVDTSFCGRILVLLAHALPLCEKSGLNLVSHFNLGNITKYDTTDSYLAVDVNLTEDNDIMEVGEISEREIPVDYTLYAKFWQLQSFFSSPATCFEKSKWRTFQQNTTEVLNIFSSHKLESSTCHEEGSKRERLKQENSNDEFAIIPSTSKTDGDEDIYFAKYLTSQKLLQLQLNDSQFRRYFLVQCLILYQYLVSDIKFKDKSFTLNDEQLRFIIESTERCFRLLRETHPKGPHFADAIKVILHREKEWSEWKNKGCLDYTQLADKEKPSVFKKRPRNRYDPSKLDLGNPELTKLWNINPDMLSACEDSKRNFIPKLVTFLEDPLDELDPEQLVEEQYKSVNNESFQWRASRLLMSQSTSYFQTPSKRNEVTANLGPFLEEVIKHTATNFPELKDRIPGFTDDGKSKTTMNSASGSASTAVHNGKEHIEPSAALTDSHIEQLAPLLASSWSTLADVMNVNKERTDAKEEPLKVAQRILTAWRQKEGKAATVKRISSVLLMAELFSEQVGQVFRGVGLLSSAN